MEPFDFIIVGAGSAGCVLANRLSADPATRVCLIEAGQDDQAWPTRWKTNTPMGNPTLLNDARFNWEFSYAAEARTGGRAIPAPRGRMLGGSSAVNGMIYIRGHRSDYDAWEAAGNVGWGWDEVLAAFRAHENHEAGSDEFHARGGELNVAPLRQLHPASRAFADAAASLQLRHNADFNGAELDGFGPYEVTQKGGQRWSSARAFLHPVRSRSNLTVLTGCLATSLVIEGGRAVAVDVMRGGARQRLDARREIVLAGGAINSPQLLLLSGIGPAAELRALGIEVRCDLPGVGRNLQDHVGVPLSVLDPTASAYALAWRFLPRLGWNALWYALARRGMFASNVVEAGGFVRTTAGLVAPDVQYVFMAALKESSRAVPHRPGFLITTTLLRPASRGWLRLASADPAEKPILTGNFLDHPDDARTLVDGLVLLRRIVAAEPFRRFAGHQILPGAGVTEDPDLAAFVHRSLVTIYHPVGTAKMGPADDPMAVVDNRLRVRGVAGLRVADCAIMPSIVSGNTNAPAMMIGERCAHFILTDRA